MSSLRRSARPLPLAKVNYPVASSNTIMSQRFISILLTTAAVCYAITDRNEYIGASELARKGLTEDKLLTSIVRARNSSKVPYLKSNGSEGFDSTLDKQPRTSIRHSESDSRDKWNILRNS